MACLSSPLVMIYTLSSPVVRFGFGGSVSGCGLILLGLKFRIEGLPRKGEREREEKRRERDERYEERRQERGEKREVSRG